MSTTPATDDCYRCGYDLRGIADEQPCPECGLLAQRSRRKSDELHNTRPRWLASLSRGVWIILAGLLFAVGWEFFADVTASSVIRWFQRSRQTRLMLQFLYESYHMVGVFVAGVCVAIGAWLLTRPEGFSPSDQRDRKRRMWLRVISQLPLAGMLLKSAATWSVESLWTQNANYSSTIPMWVVAAQYLRDGLFGSIVLCTVPVPVLLFYQLQSLAHRARNAHLAEHCAIVGIGTSASFAYGLILYLLSVFRSELHLPSNWNSRGVASLLLTTLLSAAAILFLMWSLYLLIRFAIAFGNAARKLRKTWARDDRSCC